MLTEINKNIGIWLETVTNRILGVMTRKYAEGPIMKSGLFDQLDVFLCWKTLIMCFAMLW